MSCLSLSLRFRTIDSFVADDFRNRRSLFDKISIRNIKSMKIERIDERKDD